MKNQSIKFPAITSALFIAMLSVTSCSNSTENKVEDKMDTMSANVEAKVDDMKEDYEEYRDENFVSDIIESNAQELHLLALAIKKGTNAEVKADAKKMQADHRKLDMDMRSYAKSKGFEIKADNADLKNGLDDDKMGADWDKDWVNKMVNDHEDVIAKFEKAEAKANDAELKTMATNALPTLRGHLEMARILQDKMNK